MLLVLFGVVVTGCALHTGGTACPRQYQRPEFTLHKFTDAEHVAYRRGNIMYLQETVATAPLPKQPGESHTYRKESKEEEEEDYDSHDFDFDFDFDYEK